MDTFNFLVSILIMMIGIQLHETWIVLAVLAISILTSKDLSTIIAFIIATVVLYIVVGMGNIDSLWPVAIFGLIIVAIILGSKPQEQAADPYGGGADMFGGMGGGY
ncbi:MAG: hypothetical protein NUV57_00320 [archaeon]|nr:hypothetical protein [archaeon]